MPQDEVNMDETTPLQEPIGIEGVSVHEKPPLAEIFFFLLILLIYSNGTFDCIPEAGMCVAYMCGVLIIPIAYFYKSGGQRLF